MPIQDEHSNDREHAIHRSQGDSPTEVIHNVHGCGHNFLDTFTCPDAGLEQTKSHQRIIRYTLAGIECFVRFESDTYYLHAALSEDEPEIAASAGKPPSPPEQDENPPQGLGEKAKGSETVPKTLRIERAGRPLSQSALVEINTRRLDKKYEISDILPKLWITQTPNFVVGYRGRGNLFTRVEEKDVRDAVKEWEERSEAAILRLQVLLTRLRALAGEHRGQQPLELEKGQGAGVRVRKLDNLSAVLPEDLCKLWADGQGAVDDATPGPCPISSASATSEW